MPLETRRPCSLASIAKAITLLTVSIFASACTFDGSGVGASAVDALGYEGLVLIDAQETQDLHTEHAPSDGAPADHALADARPPDRSVAPCAPDTFECLPTGEAKICKGGQWKHLGPCPLGCSPATKACHVPSNVPPRDPLQGDRRPTRH